jgi:hypothetical protein
MSNKKTTKKAPAKKVGRPTKYKKEYCQKIIEYFNVPAYKEVIEQKMSASGAVEDIRVIKPNDLRTLEGFAVHICGVCMDTLKEWRDTHPEFSSAYKKAKDMQKNMIASHAMSGGYNASFAKFMLVNNHDMKDKSEVVSENTNHNKNSYGLAFDLKTHPDDLDK